MARSRKSLTTTIDPLFEFDAPQTVVDLSVPFVPYPVGTHDPWFDQVHSQHSKSSAELARELAIMVRKLKKKKQQSQRNLMRRERNSSSNKENQQPADEARTTISLPEKRNNFTKLRSMRATQEPLKLHKTKIQVKKVSDAPTKSNKRPLADLGNRLESGRKQASSESCEKTLHELLKQHNRRFKTKHTYEPPQHSVRIVKQWERATKKSFYALSADERVLANKEIAVWKNQREEKTL
ncbi:hypothetical protein CCR75_004169 [Bremia lactucae]|uniref:Uncharacterized protein n=1 Tax=Bremia lactucae TaxID=4779 RepID=A0A976IE21_BRELC|nr:hypothetical protein CCR75_004169 [Bremia lactucae]